jgi:hypothetical protein
MKNIIFFLLFSLFFAQNIITSWDYDKVAMYDIQKINTYLLTELVKQDIVIPGLVLVHNIHVTNVRLIDVQSTLYDSYLNYNNGVFLFTPNKVTLYFNFSYSESTRGYNDSATLELKINTLKIKIKNDKISQKPKISTKMAARQEDFNVPGIQDKEFLNLLIDTLFSGFVRAYVLSELIPGIMDEGLNKYYNDFYSRKKEFKITTSEFFGKLVFGMNNNIFTYFCEDLIGDYKNNFCFYLGYTDKEEEKVDKTKIPLSNERFSHNPDNLYNVFINKDLLEDISSYVIKSYLFFNPKIYNNKTNIKKLSYDFNVASLKKFFSGLNNFRDDEYFYSEVFIDNITSTEAKYRAKINIGSNDNNFVININSKIAMNLSTKRGVRFNLCLKEAKATNIEVVSSSFEPKVEITNFEGLKNAIDESFDYDYNKICITNNGISMRDYFTKIKDIYIREEGLYLEGNHLYQ